MNRLIFLILLGCIANSSCSTSSQDVCGCASTNSKYSFNNQSGQLQYIPARNQWLISVTDINGATRVFIPCNSSFSAYRNATTSVGTGIVLPITFSGLVKDPCAGEVFPITNESMSFDYIELTSLIRQ
jgi:hypothetical protein